MSHSAPPPTEGVSNPPIDERAELRRVIGDPGSVTPRRRGEESVTAWSARAAEIYFEQIITDRLSALDALIDEWETPGSDVFAPYAAARLRDVRTLIATGRDVR